MCCQDLNHGHSVYKPDALPAELPTWIKANVWLYAWTHICLISPVLSLNYQAMKHLTIISFKGWPQKICVLRIRKWHVSRISYTGKLVRGTWPVRKISPTQKCHMTKPLWWLEAIIEVNLTPTSHPKNPKNPKSSFFIHPFLFVTIIWPFSEN